MFDFLKSSSDKDLQKELIKQLTIANALKCLESQYNSPDSLMSVAEIRQHYNEICDEIFGKDKL